MVKLDWNDPDYRENLISVLVNNYGASLAWCRSSTTSALERALDFYRPRP